MAYVANLPDELQMHIVGFFNVSTVLAVREVHAVWRAALRRAALPSVFALFSPGVFSRRLTIHDVCDARDTEGHWFAATVIAVRRDAVQVHFDGFADKWDEWVPHDTADATEDHAVVARRFCPRGTRARSPQALADAARTAARTAPIIVLVDHPAPVVAASAAAAPPMRRRLGAPLPMRSSQEESPSTPVVAASVTSISPEAPPRPSDDSDVVVPVITLNPDRATPPLVSRGPPRWISFNSRDALPIVDAGGLAAPTLTPLELPAAAPAPPLASTVMSTGAARAAVHFRPAVPFFPLTS
jgi:hypothetical protein